MAGRWAEIEIEVAGDAQEIVGPLLTERAGCYGYATTEKNVTGYLPVDERLENTLLSLRAALEETPGIPSSDITVRFVAEEDWESAWKQYYKPERIGTRIVICPTWEPWDAAPDDAVVKMDPGMAFGTGQHSTTRLCLRTVEEFVKPGMTVADVGTGSGILSIAAALLGASRVEAVDIDPLAVRIARENVEMNSVGDRVNVAESSAPPRGQFDVVVANILADVILSMVPALFDALKPGAVLITSGIIDRRAEEVRDGLATAGLTDVEIRYENDWAAVIARRP